MNKPYPAFLLTAVSLCLTGALSSLCAQTDAGAATVTVQTSVDGAATTLPIVVPPIYFYTNYTGTVTQTTVAGVTTTGTFYLAVNGNSQINATVVLGGVTTNYVGVVRRQASKERNGTGSGYLILADSANHRVPGSDRIPLTVGKGVFYGGTLGEDGTSLVFRGTEQLIQPASATVGGK